VWRYLCLFPHRRLPLQTLRTLYMSQWDAFFAQHGIRHEHMVKASSQQNGVAERLNRTIEELLVAMLNGARLPARFWGGSRLHGAFSMSRTAGDGGLSTLSALCPTVRGRP
jgi:hypothetical protein